MPTPLSRAVPGCAAHPAEAPAAATPPTAVGSLTSRSGRPVWWISHPGPSPIHHRGGPRPRRRRRLGRVQPVQPVAPELTKLDESFSTVLCVAAHPDDLECGTAAAVDRWVKTGKTVTYFLLTRGEAGIDTMDPSEAAAVREQEERAGAALVGGGRRRVREPPGRRGRVRHRPAPRHRPGDPAAPAGGRRDGLLPGPLPGRLAQPGRPPCRGPGDPGRVCERGQPLDPPGAGRRGARALGRRADGPLRRDGLGELLDVVQRR